MGGAARGQRQRGDSEQQHEQDREALLAEDVDEAGNRLLPSPCEPLFEARADARRLLLGLVGGLASARRVLVAGGVHPRRGR